MIKHGIFLDKEGKKKMAQEKKDESKLERNKYVYEQINGWIVNADNKVSISCGIFSGVFGVITFLTERITAQGTKNVCWRTINQMFFVGSLILMLVSILFYIMAINPNLGKSGKKKDGTIKKKQYPIYFGDIAEMSLDEYKRTINQASEADIIYELQNETHYNSRICSKKMKRYRIGLWLSFAAILFALGSCAARFLMMH